MPPPPPSPRTGLGLGQPGAPPRGAFYDAGRVGADGVHMMRPQTPSVPGRAPPPSARPLRPQHTGPSHYMPRGPAPPPSPHPGMPRGRTPTAPTQPPPRTATPAGGGFGAPAPATPGPKSAFQYRASSKETLLTQPAVTVRTLHQRCVLWLMR